MIIGPTSYFGVEPTDQIGGRHAQRSFDVSADTIQKGLAILFGRLFPLGYLRTFCPRKSKPFSTCVDRKSTRLNSSHDQISYAVFCLKKKKKKLLPLLLTKKKKKNKTKTKQTYTK